MYRHILMFNTICHYIHIFSKYWNTCTGYIISYNDMMMVLKCCLTKINCTVFYQITVRSVTKTTSIFVRSTTSITIWKCPVLVCFRCHIRCPELWRMPIQCCYCPKEVSDFDEAIYHVTCHHGDSILKITYVTRTDNKLVEQTKNFNIIPTNLERENKCIVPNNITSRIKIARRPDVNTRSPIHRIKKRKWQSTPTKKLFEEALTTADNDVTPVNVVNDGGQLERSFANISLHDTPLEEMPFEDETSDEDSSDSDIRMLTEILPGVVKSLKKAGQLVTFVKCNRLLMDNK